MSKDIDLYEFKGTLKKFDCSKGSRFLNFCEDKAVAVMEVGKTNKGIDSELLSLGYKKGEKVLIVIQ
jgi:hypothetical protein